MAKSKKVIVGRMEPNYDETSENVSRYGWKFVVLSGNAYCKYGKGHRHQFEGVGFFTGIIEEGAHCTACHKAVQEQK